MIKTSSQLLETSRAAEPRRRHGHDGGEEIAVPLADTDAEGAGVVAAEILVSFVRWTSPTTPAPAHA